jgi:hypothetical protein
MKKISNHLFSFIAFVCATGTGFTIRESKPFMNVFSILAMYPDSVDSDFYEYPDVIYNSSSTLHYSFSPYNNISGGGLYQQELNWFISHPTGLNYPGHSPSYVRFACISDSNSLCIAYTVNGNGVTPFPDDEVLAVATGDIWYYVF